MLFLLLLLLFLFFFEKRTLFSLLYFIGLTIIIAIFISLNPIIRFIDGEYLSYILILVQVGAISVLFGLIIMLLPDGGGVSSTPPLPVIFLKGPSRSLKGVPSSLFSPVLLLLLSALFLSLLFFFPPFPFLKGLLGSLPLFCSELLPRFSFLNSPPPLWEGSLGQTPLLFKIGIALYTFPPFIFKFFLLTILLLLAIIGLFFSL
jgi:NADH:ubiquinone oxidoreductase subunit 6 (subunit J)